MPNKRRVAGKAEGKGRQGKGMPLLLQHQACSPQWPSMPKPGPISSLSPCLSGRTYKMSHQARLSVRQRGGLSRGMCSCSKAQGTEEGGKGVGNQWGRHGAIMRAWLGHRTGGRGGLQGGQVSCCNVRFFTVGGNGRWGGEGQEGTRPTTILSLIQPPVCPAPGTASSFLSGACFVPPSPPHATTRHPSLVQPLTPRHTIVSNTVTTMECHQCHCSGRVAGWHGGRRVGGGDGGGGRVAGMGWQAGMGGKVAGTKWGSGVRCAVQCAVCLGEHSKVTIPAHTPQQRKNNIGWRKVGEGKDVMPQANTRNRDGGKATEVGIQIQARGDSTRCSSPNTSSTRCVENKGRGEGHTQHVYNGMWVGSGRQGRGHCSNAAAAAGVQGKGTSSQPNQHKNVGRGE